MTSSPTSSPLRVRVFVDFWNFSLSVRNGNPKFLTDWSRLGTLLAEEAAKLISPNNAHNYEAMHVYGSYDPNKPEDARLKNWFINKLDHMPGVHVVLLERQKKRGYPKCPKCQTEAMYCAACNSDMRGTEEKGIDTRMATDLISLAWAKGYDAAVLVSADRDFVPVAEFLQTKGIKIVHGSFPPNGRHLSQKCWGSLDLERLRPMYER